MGRLPGQSCVSLEAMLRHFCEPHAFSFSGSLLPAHTWQFCCRLLNTCSLCARTAHLGGSLVPPDQLFGTALLFNTEMWLLVPDGPRFTRARVLLSQDSCALITMLPMTTRQ